MTKQEPTGVVAAVQRDHREIEQLFEAVESAQGQSRRDAFDRLAGKLRAHEEAEEQVVHPLAKSDGIEGTVEELEQEEQTASTALGKLEGMDVDSDEFARAFTKLKRDALAHAQQEERDEHPRLLADIPTDELERSADAFDRVERSASE